VIVPTAPDACTPLSVTETAWEVATEPGEPVACTLVKARDMLTLSAPTSPVACTPVRAIENAREVITVPTAPDDWTPVRALEAA
jgi:hypothetical protein